jgi:16S rRNA (adenine1518-N6/adenine1519-N6)-dimethyltransferase
VIRARKQFGQHFLEPAWVDKVVAAINPSGDDHFIEIGPGRGALTVPLAARVAEVIGVEIDRHLAATLQARALPNLTLIEGDFLDPGVQAQLGSLIAAARSPFRVAGNLPYNVASPMLFSFVELFTRGLPLVDATVMLQREVADRLLAVPGTKAYGAMTVLIGHHTRVDRLLNLPRGAFRPAPKVLSTVVRLSFHAPEPVVRNANFFHSLVQAVFSRRRKTMANAIRALDGAKALPGWLDGRRRPETLGIAEFARLADDFSQ